MKIQKEKNLLIHEEIDDLLRIRRRIHSHPELSGHEFQTAALVAGELRQYGWNVREGVGKTGIIAEFGEPNSSFVGVRVDMDALPIEEKTGLSFSSSTPGVMHACGHDIHTTIGLGVAKLISKIKDLPIGVRILFQPAEEIASGARWMIADGALNDLKALFGVHVCPDLPVGAIGIKRGSLTSAAAELIIEIIGKAGHGARPYQSVDAIWAASKVISGVQEAISRKLNALHPVVITFGKITGGKTFNVVADNVKIIGTVRSPETELFHELPNWLKENVENIAKSCGAESKVSFREIAPPVKNDEALNEIILQSARNILDEKEIVQLSYPSMGAEDFAEFLDYVPGAMFRLGVAASKGCSPLHSSQFNPDEDCLKIGIEVLVESLLTWISSQQF
tara:strand:+ start:25875 stop:27053 length:1179 start_codon:yes stop_codon:yes gene_type:complete